MFLMIRVVCQWRMLGTNFLFLFKALIPSFALNQVIMSSSFILATAMASCRQGYISYRKYEIFTSFSYFNLLVFFLGRIQQLLLVSMLGFVLPFMTYILMAKAAAVWASFIASMFLLFATALPHFMF